MGGLSFDTSDENLKQYFSKYGSVYDAVVMRDLNTKRSRGFGFCTFNDQSTAELVMSTDIEHIIDNRKVETKWAVPRDSGTSPSLMGTHGSHLSTNNSTSSSLNASPYRLPSGSGDSSSSSCESTGASSRKIFVGGLHYETGDNGLYEYFEQFGKVETAQVLFNRETNKSRGFGFVTFIDAVSINNIFYIKTHMIHGKAVEIKRAVPKNECLGLHYKTDRSSPSFPSSSSFGPQSRPYSSSLNALHSNGGGLHYIDSPFRERSFTSSSPMMSGASPMMSGASPMMSGSSPMMSGIDGMHSYRPPSNSDGSLHTSHRLSMGAPYLQIAPTYSSRIPNSLISPIVPSSSTEFSYANITAGGSISTNVWGGSNKNNRVFSPYGSNNAYSPMMDKSINSINSSGSSPSFGQSMMSPIGLPLKSTFDLIDHSKSPLLSTLSSSNVTPSRTSDVSESSTISPLVNSLSNSVNSFSSSNPSASFSMYNNSAFSSESDGVGVNNSAFGMKTHVNISPYNDEGSFYGNSSNSLPAHFLTETPPLHPSASGGINSFDKLKLSSGVTSNSIWDNPSNLSSDFSSSLPPPHPMKKKGWFV